jgi:hypothetical protein
LDLLWLPKRCPQLNPLDTLWGQGKDLRNATKQYASIDEQVDRFLGYRQSWSGPEAWHTAGVLSGHFWLRHALSKTFADLLSLIPTSSECRESLPPVDGGNNTTRLLQAGGDQRGVSFSSSFFFPPDYLIGTAFFLTYSSTAEGLAGPPMW